MLAQPSVQKPIPTLDECALSYSYSPTPHTAQTLVLGKSVCSIRPQVLHFPCINVKTPLLVAYAVTADRLRLCVVGSRVRTFQPPQVQAQTLGLASVVQASTHAPPVGRLRVLNG